MIVQMPAVHNKEFDGRIFSGFSRNSITISFEIFANGKKMNAYSLAKCIIWFYFIGLFGVSKW